jgi:hypothetical protein
MWFILLLLEVKDKAVIQPDTIDRQKKFIDQGSNDPVEWAKNKKIARSWQGQTCF